MQKLTVNPNACIGCGACVALDNEHFDFSDAGTSMAISNENLESDALHTAIDSCPTSAISIVETEEPPTTNNEEAQAECNGNCEHCTHHEEDTEKQAA